MAGKRNIVVVGDALLDIDLDGSVTRMAPDAPVPVVEDPSERLRPGGAALAACLVARSGARVTLVCALGHDGAGRRLRRLLERCDVTVADLGATGATPEKMRVHAAGRPMVRLDRGGAGDVGPGPLSEAARVAIAAADAVLVSDYGRGMAAHSQIRELLAGGACGPVVWDPHPRGPVPVRGVTLVTPNAAEAAAAAQALPSATTIVRATPADGAPLGRPAEVGTMARAEDDARVLVGGWNAGQVAVTVGSKGALLVGGPGPALVVPAHPARGGDPCGAGDQFAAAATVTLAAGRLPSEAVTVAVAAASAFVDAGGAAAARLLPVGVPDGAASSQEVDGPPADPRPVADATEAGDGPVQVGHDRARRFARTAGDPLAAARAIRAGGGTLVATGGCFDLLHAGHVRTLAAARALGDGLVVLLNSDLSVRRLKGEDRPLVGEQDRAAVLLALESVDAVMVFEEDDPRRALEVLRPDVWVKGGDYAVGDLPEAATLASWGGRAVVVPFVAGRSTTKLIQEAVARAS